MKLKAAEISDIIRRQIRDFDREIDVAETGTVLSVGDGIARVYGMEQAMAGELVEFSNGVRGMVLNLESDNVGIAVMGPDREIREGDVVRRLGEIVQVPVGEALCGCSEPSVPLALRFTRLPPRRRSRRMRVPRDTGGDALRHAPD